MHTEEQLKFAKTHEWSFIEGDTITVGLSHYAQEQISDIVFVELPKIGQSVTASSACAVIESVKSASDLYAPCSGEILEINDKVVADPSLVNSSPYGDGWLFKIKISNPQEADNLLSIEDYKNTLN